MKPINQSAHPNRCVESAQPSGKTAYCRCWQSQKFPYCDGSHRTHNEQTGDTLGPLVIEWGSSEDVLT